MKQKFFKIGSVMCLATLLSCSTDNEASNTSNDEPGINSTASKTADQNYISTAHEMSENIDYENFVFEDAYIQNFLIDYNLPMKELITADFVDELFDGKSYVDTNGIKSYFLSKGFQEYTANIMVDVENNIDISDVILTAQYSSLPALDKSVIQSAIDLQSDLFSYNGTSVANNISNTYMMGTYSDPTRRNTWMLIGIGVGAGAGFLIAGPPGAAGGALIGGMIGYASGIIADVTE